MEHCGPIFGGMQHIRPDHIHVIRRIVPQGNNEGPSHMRFHALLSCVSRPRKSEESTKGEESTHSF